MNASSKFSIRYLEDSIILLSVNEGVELDLKDAKEMRRQMVAIAENKKYCVLMDARRHFHVSHEARTIIAGKEYSNDRIAAAFIVTSTAMRIAGNFFILIDRPSSPTKIFNDEERALDWLREHIQEFNQKTKKSRISSELSNH